MNEGKLTVKEFEKMVKLLQETSILPPQQFFWPLHPQLLKYSPSWRYLQRYIRRGKKMKKGKKK